MIRPSPITAMTVDPKNSQHTDHLPHRLDTDMDSSTVTSPGQGDCPRGRRRTREHSHSDHEVDHNGEAVGADGADGTGSSRKRRRSRKGLDKKFVCPYEDCGKSYSRAEHLYRHQLNRKYLSLILHASKAVIATPGCYSNDGVCTESFCGGFCCNIVNSCDLFGRLRVVPAFLRGLQLSRAQATSDPVLHALNHISLYRVMHDKQL